MPRPNGYLYALTSAAGAGSIATLGKLALAGAHPVVITALINLIAAGVLFPFAPWPTVRRGDWPLVVAIALLGGLLGPVLFYAALVYTTATNAALLVNSETLFTILIAMGALGERGNRQEYSAVGLLAIGALVVATNLQASPAALLASMGSNALMLLSYLVWGLDNNISRILSDRNRTLQLVWLKYLIGGSVLVLAVPILGLNLQARPDAYAPLAALGLVYAFTTWTFYAALQRIGAMRSIALFSTTTLFGVSVAWVVLGEGIAPPQVLGGGLMGLGVLLIALNERRRHATGAPGDNGPGVPAEHRGG